MKFPRSLAIKMPYRGRTLRGLIRNRIPGGRFAFDFYLRQKGKFVATLGRRRLGDGKSEGRRFLAAIPHQFCGIGHSHAEWHTAYQWASLLGLEFVHIPLKGDWDRFFGLTNLIQYEQVIRELKPTIIRVPYATGWSAGKEVFTEIQKFIDSIRSDKDMLFVLADGQNAYDHITHAAHFQKLFYEKGDWRALPKHRVAGKLNVAVHLRRGDVAQMAADKSSNWEARYVPEEWFMMVMDAIQELVPNQSPVFNIYSQGKTEDFPLVAARKDTCFHLDASEEETLLNMAKADILVMSPSGFSYLAAMMSEGIKIARYPWWHHIPDTKGWIRVEKDEPIQLGEKLVACLSHFQ